MKDLSKYAPLFWLALLAYLGFYVYGIILGVFNPVEMIVFTIPALIFLGLYLVHARGVRRAIQDHDDPRHEAEMRAARNQRERRGW